MNGQRRAVASLWSDLSTGAKDTARLIAQLQMEVEGGTLWYNVQRANAKISVHRQTGWAETHGGEENCNLTVFTLHLENHVTVWRVYLCFKMIRKQNDPSIFFVGWSVSYLRRQVDQDQIYVQYQSPESKCDFMCQCVLQWVLGLLCHVTSLLRTPQVGQLNGDFQHVRASFSFVSTATFLCLYGHIGLILTLHVVLILFYMVGTWVWTESLKTEGDTVKPNAVLFNFLSSLWTTRVIPVK